MAGKRKLWHPLLWPSWLLVGVLWLIAQLPMPTKLRIGDALGRFAFRHMRSVANVTRTNLELCFPEMHTTEREQLAEDAFAEVAKGAFEGLHAWWRDVGPYIETMDVVGFEHLQAARDKGRGVLIMGGHFSILDIAMPLVWSVSPNIGYMYRANSNPVIDWMIQRGRDKNHGIRPFNKHQLRLLIDHLREGGEAWYACDQDQNGPENVFVPFFGVPANCLTTPSWIARESGAAVVFLSQFRLEDGRYQIRFSPLPDDFGADPRRDAEDWNRVLEDNIRLHPSHYLWLHKRFKRRPEGMPPVYG